VTSSGGQKQNSDAAVNSWLDREISGSSKWTSRCSYTQLQQWHTLSISRTSVTDSSTIAWMSAMQLHAHGHLENSQALTTQLTTGLANVSIVTAW